MQGATRTKVLVAALAFGLSGCAFQANLNSTYFEYQPRAYDKKVVGVAVVEMSKTEQENVFTGNPTSFTGGGTTLTLPMGTITREAATLAFKDVFSQGVKVSDSVQSPSEFSAVIHPRVTQYTYEYNQLKNAGFAITPTVNIGLSVSLRDSRGNAIWERNFSTGNFEGKTYVMSGSPGEEISKTTHQAMMKVMQEAADAIQRDLIVSPPPQGDKAL